MIDIAGIIVPLMLLIYLAYRGISVLLLGPVISLVAVLFAKNTPMLATYTQIYMPALGNFVILYFPLFLLGALFGRLMDDSNSALVISRSIVNKLGAKHAILAVVLSCAILTYGGVSLFVVAFAVYPIASALFKEAQIPKRIIPATIALGSFTFTMTALPGTPAIQNAIPMPYFGTTPFAAPGLGIIASLVMFLGGWWWLTRQSFKAKLAGEGYKSFDYKELPDEIAVASSDQDLELVDLEGGPSAGFTSYQEKAQPSFLIALAPIILVVSLNYILSSFVFPKLNTAYLSQAIYGSINISSVIGVWSIICSLVASILLLIVLNIKNITSIRESLNNGASASVLPLLNTASLVGFGAVMSKLPSFSLVQTYIENMSGSVLVDMSISINILAGITGSASGGMSIALQALGQHYISVADSLGISHELLHRVTTIATGGLDSLPHNGAVVTLLGICGLTHKSAYKDIFFVAVVFPILALAVVVLLGSYFGAF